MMYYYVMDYLDLAYELKNSIKNDERFILLDKLEKEMKASLEVQSLYKDKEEKQKEL